MCYNIYSRHILFFLFIYLPLSFISPINLRLPLSGAAPNILINITTFIISMPLVVRNNNISPDNHLLFLCRSWYEIIIFTSQSIIISMPLVVRNNNNFDPINLPGCRVVWLVLLPLGLRHIDPYSPRVYLRVLATAPTRGKFTDPLGRGRTSKHPLRLRDGHSPHPANWRRDLRGNLQGYSMS